MRTCNMCVACSDMQVIPPGQYVVLSTDLGVEEVVEDDAETQRKVVRSTPAMLLLWLHRCSC